MGFWETALTVGAIYLSYCTIVCIRRIFFHPLSGFPGPKFAACTLWYEFYYDVVLEGKWVWRIKDMHEKYGPIVRINPHELHIKDPEFYDEIYGPATGGKVRNKYSWWVNMAGAPVSIFATTEHSHHRLRRAPLNPFFSKQAVRNLEPLIWEKVNTLVSRLDRATKEEQVIRADCAFMALTMDVICSYCFGHDPKYLQDKDLGLSWKETINGAWQNGALLRAFPQMANVMRVFPRTIAMKIDPNMGKFLAWQDSVKDMVRPIMENNDGKNNHRTIFHTLRDSDLPPEEKSIRRLCDEGEIFTGAGSETTAKTLTTILFYLTTNPEILQSLRSELATVATVPNTPPSWSELERLPYLSAIVQEGLRLSHGITTRLPRTASEPLFYKNFQIPSGTPVSQTPYFVLSDENVFFEPQNFKPERWLGYHGLDKYQVVFGKGSRACIGMNLAYAELTMTCAALFRRFRFELFETSFKDIEMVHDFFVAAPAEPRRGVRVRVFNVGKECNTLSL
ncbi:Hypothetical protein R9X50_00421400 [Acrodontium crateriforme]|uniref:Cytochrome P450 n=1 Tax=Acrodontium crateriforme TaxID=150365 RepID=A0AAQ3R4V8_9PEZI|nr:Hypothetical protein R9X50_00421400 [Acrodontium crateriforme]